MGYGSYSASDWSRLKSSRNLSDTQSVNEIFQRRACNPKFDPKFIGTRECFDSEDHPNTTPIVVGLDRVMKKIFVNEDWPAEEWSNDDWAEEELDS